MSAQTMKDSGGPGKPLKRLGSAPVDRGCWPKALSGGVRQLTEVRSGHKKKTEGRSQVKWVFYP